MPGRSVPPCRGARPKAAPARFALALATLLVVLAAPAFAAAPGVRALTNPAAFFIVPAAPCVEDDVLLDFEICTCNTQWIRLEHAPDGHVRLDVRVDPQVACVRCAPDTMGIRLGHFAAGNYQMKIEIVSHIVGVATADSVFSETQVLAFTVSPTCASPALIPYLDSVRIGRPNTCSLCPPSVCAGDSIPVFLSGVFPDACTRLVEVRRFPSPIVGPFPEPDIVQIVYETNAPCGACGLAFVRWSAEVHLPPLPAKSYGLIVEAILRDTCSQDSLRNFGPLIVPFAVSDTCGTSPACFDASFAHPLLGPCDAFVGPDHPAVATLDLSSTEPLGGVQGHLRFDQPGLRVSAIEAIPPDWLVSWLPTEAGADFVAVHLIRSPGTVADASALATLPLLNVHAEVLPGALQPDLARLVPVDLLAASKLGQDVPQCIQVTDARDEFRDPAARFCREQGCDYNGDFRADVRDLVLMLLCLRDSLDVCSHGNHAQLDCDGDGDQDLDDVLCCARVILGGAHPDSTGAQPAPEVALEFGAPVATADGIDVPVALQYPMRVGAARLSFTYPDQVFAGASIELTDHPANWLALDQTGGGRATMGAIRLAPDYLRGDQSSIIPPLRMTIHLRTRAGQSVVGSIAFVSGDFADAGGATLVTSAAPVAMPLAGGPRVALSATRPNPFTSETRFSIALTQDSQLEVSVYDLVGRRVATLFRGLAPAGTRNFTWRRTRDDGVALGSGVYFVRATAGGQAVGGKMLVLSSE